MMLDKRKPKLEKIGCYFQSGDDSEFHYFEKATVKDGDVFIYNKGILWKVK